MRRLLRPRLAYGIVSRCGCPCYNGCSDSPSFVFQPHRPWFHRVPFSNWHGRTLQQYSFYFLSCYFAGLSFWDGPFPALLSDPLCCICYWNFCRLLLVFAYEGVRAGSLGILLIFSFLEVPLLAYPLFLKFLPILHRWRTKSEIREVRFLECVWFWHRPSTLFLRVLP